MSESLGLLLVRAGVISREALYRALDVQRETGRFLGSCLLAIGACAPEQLHQALAQQLKLPLVDGRDVLAASQALASRVPTQVVRRFRVVPFAYAEGTLRVALYEPGAVQGLPEIGFFSGDQVEAHWCNEAVVERAIAQLYPALAKTMAPLPAPAGAPATPPTPAHRDATPAPVVPLDRRRPAELLKPLTEISNRDFGKALGLESSPPIPLVARTGKPWVHFVEVDPGPPIGIVQAAEQVFAVAGLQPLAEVGVRFLQAWFPRVACFDVSVSPGTALAATRGMAPPALLDVWSVRTVAELIELGQVFHGRAPSGGAWSALYKQLGIPRPGSLLLAPVHASGSPKLLFYADRPEPEPHDDLHDVAFFLREIATALSINSTPR